MQNYLNVVFHGTFAFVDRGVTVEAIVPTVMSHVYKAGTWKNEIDLQTGTTYTLQGVTAAYKSPDLADLGIPVLSGKRKISGNSGLAFCSFVLAPPMTFVARRCFTPLIGQPLFEGSDGTPATRQMRSYAETHVFIYACPDAGKVGLANLGWEAPAGNDIVNLHIFAEPDAPMSMSNESHILDSFSTLMQLMQGNLEISKSVRGARFIPSECGSQPVPGLPVQEELSLQERAGIKPTDADPAACASGGAHG